MSLLEVSDVVKVYKSPFSRTHTTALDGITFQVDAGEFVAIMGESGSGKSTLLNILAAFDTADGGEVLLEGTSLKKLKGESLSAFRRDNLGFVFQEFNLLDMFTNRDNIYLPMVLAGKKPAQMKKAIAPLAKALSIEAILDKYPYEISGGQKQRVAAARALIQSPSLLLADEPTGALDSRSSDEMLKMFETLNQQGQTILMVTHSVKAACYASRVLFIRDGRLFHQLYRGDRSRAQMFDEISKVLTLLSNKENS